MIIAMPNLDAVRDALSAFRAAVATASADIDALSPAARAGLHDERAAAITLHADLFALAEQVTEHRDAVLSLARSAGAAWKALEQTSGIADSTLRDQLTRWEAKT